MLAIAGRSNLHRLHECNPVCMASGTTPARSAACAAWALRRKRTKSKRGRCTKDGHTTWSSHLLLVTGTLPQRQWIEALVARHRAVQVASSAEGSWHAGPAGAKVRRARARLSPASLQHLRLRAQLCRAVARCGCAVCMRSCYQTATLVPAWTLEQRSLTTVRLGMRALRQRTQRMRVARGAHPAASPRGPPAPACRRTTSRAQSGPRPAAPRA
jgi:hypothetical protein